MITAAAAGDSLVVLPLIMEAAKELLRDTGAPVEEANRAVSVSVPLLYNFPHAGKVLSLAFLPFAAWMSGSILSVSQLGQLAFAGVLSLFGSVNAAMPFLLDLLHLPADLFELFTLSSVVNSRFGSMTAAMHVAMLGVLVSAAMLGQLQVDLRRLVRFAVLTLVLVAGFIGRYARHLYLDTASAGVRPQHAVVVHPEAASRPRNRPDDDGSAPSGAPARTPGARIRARRMLRVGYFPDAVPWAFFNAKHELVGYDIEAAHRLADQMKLTLTFVPSTRPSATDDLASGRIDILMSGFIANVARAERMELSRPYSTEHVGFLVPDHLRGRFATLQDLNRGAGLTVGAPNVEGSRDFLAATVPEATVRDYEVVEKTMLDGSDETLMMTLERAFYWSRVHPEYPPCGRRRSMWRRSRCMRCPAARSSCGISSTSGSTRGRPAVNSTRPMSTGSAAAR